MYYVFLAVFMLFTVYPGRYASNQL